MTTEPFSEKMNSANLDYFEYTKTRAFYKASLAIPECTVWYYNIHEITYMCQSYNIELKLHCCLINYVFFIVIFQN